MERSARAEHQDPQFVNPRFFVKFQARPANSAVIQTRFKPFRRFEFAVVGF